MARKTPNSSRLWRRCRRRRRSGRASTGAAGSSGAYAPLGGCCCSSITRCRLRFPSTWRRRSRDPSPTRQGWSSGRRGWRRTIPSSSFPGSSRAGSSSGRATNALMGCSGSASGAAPSGSSIKGKLSPEKIGFHIFPLLLIFCWTFQASNFNVKLSVRHCPFTGKCNSVRVFLYISDFVSEEC